MATAVRQTFTRNVARQFFLSVTRSNQGPAYAASETAVTPPVAAPELTGGYGPGGTAFAEALDRVRDRIADPLFDDLALALTLHWRRGGKLVPALEALVADWTETLRLQSEAKAMRSGVEASVILLALLPFVFLITLQLLAPALLAPFRSTAGEVVFGLAVAWMAFGYGVLQRMSEPPRESRLRLREVGG